MQDLRNGHLAQNLARGSILKQCHSHLAPYDGRMTQAIDNLSGRLASSGLPPGVAEDSAIKMLSGAVHRQATMMAYNDVFWMMGLCFVLCLPLLLLLGERRVRSAPIPR